MKLHSVSLILLLGASVTTLAAQAPAARRSPAYYSKICTNSPFTVAAKKGPAAGAEAETPLSAWALSGFGLIGDKIIVLLQNKKKADERITIVTGEKNDKNIEVLQIERGTGYMQDRVQLRIAGSVEGWVGYDPQFLKLAAPTPQQQEKK